MEKTITFSFNSSSYEGTSLSANEEKFLETILQIPSEYENLQNGVLKGNVIQADTGRAVGNAEITLRKNLNAKTGNSVASATSSSNGTYLFENLPTGYYTMEVAKSGYAVNYINVVVVGGREVVRQVTLSPRLNENELRVVLEWDASPRDLNSHLIGESANGGQFHVSYSNTRYYENGTYQYYVHDYTNRYNSGSSALSNSDAKVKVYTASGYTEYTVPQNQAGTKWSVFKMVSGEIIPINTLE